MESLIVAHSLTRIRWYRVIQAPRSATPGPSNPAGEKSKKAKKLKSREDGQNKSASDMVQRLAPNHLRLLSDGGSPPTGSTHDSAYFNPDSRLRLLRLGVWPSLAPEREHGRR